MPEIPEIIRLSLQTGEWVSSIFQRCLLSHPYKPKFPKYLRFHCQNQTFHLKALPFGLSTTPMKFTMVVKEVNLLAQDNYIRILQYRDDWLIQTKYKKTLSPAYLVPPCPLSVARLDCKPTKFGPRNPAVR